MKVNILPSVIIFIGFISSNTFADTNKNLVESLYNCSKVLNNEQRLVCFDKLVPKSIAPLNLLKKNDESVLVIEQVKSNEKQQIDDFSKEDLKKTEEEKGPESITATISNVKQLIRGQWVIYLENGQKWQQQDSKKIKLKVGDNIRLKKGSMGAVYLFKEGSHRNIRVKRLK